METKGAKDDVVLLHINLIPISVVSAHDVSVHPNKPTQPLAR
jgi:hypothetical protein